MWNRLVAARTHGNVSDKALLKCSTPMKLSPPCNVAKLLVCAFSCPHLSYSARIHPASRTRMPVVNEIKFGPLGRTLEYNPFSSSPLQLQPLHILVQKTFQNAFLWTHCERICAHHIWACGSPPTARVVAILTPNGRIDNVQAPRHPRFYVGPFQSPSDWLRAKSFSGGSPPIPQSHIYAVDTFVHSSQCRLGDSHALKRYSRHLLPIGST